MNTTSYVIIAVVILLIGYDIFAALHWGYKGTISYDLLTAAKARKVIALAFAMLMAHLFCQEQGSLTPYVLIGLGLGMLVAAQ